MEIKLSSEQLLLMNSITFNKGDFLCHYMEK
jgi:hypothetical protein